MTPITYNSVNTRMFQKVSLCLFGRLDFTLTEEFNADTVHWYLDLFQI